MKVATAEQMQELDRKTIETYRIPGIVLMEKPAEEPRKYLSLFPDLQRGNRSSSPEREQRGGFISSLPAPS
jgi:hypothetical protein